MSGPQLSCACGHALSAGAPKCVMCSALDHVGEVKLTATGEFPADMIWCPRKNGWLEGEDLRKALAEWLD